MNGTYELIYTEHERDYKSVFGNYFNSKCSSISLKTLRLVEDLNTTIFIFYDVMPMVAYI